MFRATSRVLLIDADGRVLMFLQYGKDRGVAPRWITPGGGVDAGESHDQAAIRELREETGLVLDAVPAPFFEEDFPPDQRWHPYDEGHWAWYAIRVDHFEPDRTGWTDEEIADVLEWRWFTADELRSEHASGHEVEPETLPEMLIEEILAQEQHIQKTQGAIVSDLPVYSVADLEVEPVLDVPEFTNDDAVDLGLIAVDVIRERGHSLAVKIVLRGDTVFLAKLRDTGPGNDEWLDGKAAVVRRFGEPSLLVRRRHEEAMTPFDERDDVDHSTHRAHGGSMPIRVGGELVGTITTSGEPDVVDHSMTSEAVRRWLTSR